VTRKFSNLTAVVCTLNSENSLERCLVSLVEIVDFLIVVDGGSSDGTLAIADKYANLMLYDSGSGLGEARGLGLVQVKTDYILNCGADNILSSKVVNKMLKILESTPVVYGVSCQTVVEEKGYLSKVSNRIWRTRFTSGYSQMVGTPNIFRTQQLRKFGYSKTRGWSDDEEICIRMYREEKALFEIIDDECQEIGQATLRRQIYRYFHYGFSDFEIFSARKKEWNFLRQVKSILHPFRVELLNPVIRLSVLDKFFCLPVMFSATLLRYSGWVYRLLISGFRNGTRVN
jgi:glycosyltransferase involved in cell wall biosynthesis